MVNIKTIKKKSPRPKTAAVHVVSLYCDTPRGWGQVVPERSMFRTRSDVFLHILQNDSVDFDGQTLQQP